MPSDTKRRMPLEIDGDGVMKGVEIDDSFDLSLPFFHHAVNDFMERNPDAEPIEIGSEERLAFPDREPMGIIYHASRCGSTLIGQALARLENTVVFSEAQPINSSIHWAKTERTRAIRSIFNAMASGVMSEQLFIKQTSINVVRLSSVLAAYPSVPWIFVYRHPVEIMVSVERSKTGWARQYGQPFSHFSLGVEERAVEGLSFEEYMALALDRMFTKAMERDDGHGLFIDYADLNPDVMVRIATHFGLEPNQDQITAMTGAFNVYSKDASREKRHNTNDSDDKRREASAAIREAAELPLASYDRLRNRRGV
ncbi:MAG: hypothetical protein AAF525_12175 [Pseudomonadota bacterium]